jgi:LDH2 family malate/lactate/ureidoglycolate dehydrogenase
MTQRLPAERVRAFLESLFTAAGLSEDNAAICADALLLQEMRGVRTHGLRRVTQYLDSLERGSANATPHIRVLREMDATVMLDADGALGIIACAAAMDRAIDRARRHGIGIVTVVNSNHFLGAAPYCIRAAEAGMIGIACSNSFPAMAYPGTMKAVMGNSPIGYAVPTSLGFPLVFDSAMTTSGGKLLEWARAGELIPDGLAGLDASGRRTTDPGAVLAGGATLPIGLHKGAGLALLVELLTGVLGGGGFLHTVPSDADLSWRMTDHSQCCIAIDIAHFMPVEVMQARVAAYARDLERFGDDVQLPGERAHRSVQDCLANGIAPEDDVAAELRSAARRLGVEAPF